MLLLKPLSWRWRDLYKPGVFFLFIFLLKTSAFSRLRSFHSNLFIPTHGTTIDSTVLSGFFFLSFFPPVWQWTHQLKDMALCATSAKVVIRCFSPWYHYHMQGYSLCFTSTSRGVKIQKTLKYKKQRIKARIKLKWKSLELKFKRCRFSDSVYVWVCLGGRQHPTVYTLTWGRLAWVDRTGCPVMTAER